MTPDIRLCIVFVTAGRFRGIRLAIGMDIFCVRAGILVATVIVVFCVRATMSNIYVTMKQNSGATFHASHHKNLCNFYHGFKFNLPPRRRNIAGGCYTQVANIIPRLPISLLHSVLVSSFSPRSITQGWSVGRHTYESKYP